MATPSPQCTDPVPPNVKLVVQPLLPTYALAVVDTSLKSAGCANKIKQCGGVVDISYEISTCDKQEALADPRSRVVTSQLAVSKKASGFDQFFYNMQLLF